MNNSSALILIAVALGGCLQYIWLLTIPATARTAEAVVIATALLTLLTLKLLPKGPSKTAGVSSSLTSVVVCVCVSTFTATATLFVAEAFGHLSAVSNTLSNVSVKSLLLTALVTGGWVVGLLSAAARLVILKRKNPPPALNSNRT